MKKYGTVIALGLAVLFGVVAVMLANRWLTTRASGDKVVVKDAVPLTKIVIAAKDLDVGTKLTPENLTLADWPKANVPKGTFDKIAAVEGRVNVARMVAGEPLVGSELAAPGSGAGLVALIPPGERAMSIRVDEVIGVGGFVLPNTFVDVISIPNQGKSKQQAQTILKKIQVLAIAQETYTEEGKAKVVRTVTMAVTPEQAEKLALRTHDGSIQLVLRNPLEKEEVQPKPAPVVKRVVARRRPVRVLRPRVYAPPAPTFQVELIQGDKPPEKYKFKVSE
jgi:pilus assembly protein CpaB